MATHILVVDDETAIADLVEVYLKNEGFTIHKFYNASDALACVRTTRLNLAVLDLNAAKGIPEQYPQIKHWYIGGHSLGGSMAASHAANNTSAYARAVCCE